MPTSWFDEAARKARKLKALLSGEENVFAYLKLRSKRHEFKQLRDEIASKKQESEQAKDEIEDTKDELATIKQETKQIKNEFRTAEDPPEKASTRRGREEYSRRDPD